MGGAVLRAAPPWQIPAGHEHAERERRPALLFDNCSISCRMVLLEIKRQRAAFIDQRGFQWVIP